VEWLYATGPVEVRKSEVQILPDTMSAATDRQHNVTTFRAERYVLITWDQRIHAAVQVDRTITPVT
jgi:Tfp pilus assembly protein PilN